MKKIELHLDGTSPERLSMKRLSDYLRLLVDLYGEENAVHFDKVGIGSACLEAYVEDDHYHEVLVRASAAASNNSPSSRARKAYLSLVDELTNDGFVGSLRNDEGAKIIQFPKKAAEAAPICIWQDSSIQGTLYSIGGKDETVPVRLTGDHNETLMCEATREVAAKLSAHLFKKIQLNGYGEWIRDNNSWHMKKLKIHSFVLLEDASIHDSIEELRGYVSGWNSMNDPHAVIKEMRD